MNRDGDLVNPRVAKEGILSDDKTQCQSVPDLVTLEIEQYLDILDLLESVDLNFRRADNSEYDRAFAEAAKKINKSTTSKPWPKAFLVE
jgi:hypothetical protein